MINIYFHVLQLHSNLFQSIFYLKFVFMTNILMLRDCHIPSKSIFFKKCRCPCSKGI